MCNLFKRHEPGEEEYSTSVFTGYLPELRGSKYLKINEFGQVIEHGRTVWGKKGEVFLVELPFIHPEAYKSGVEWGQKGFILEYKIGEEVSLKVEVKLTICFVSSEWDWQELYDKVIRRGYSHIYDWIAAEFEKVALNDKEVCQAFINYAEHDRPTLFIEELGKALKKIPFSGKPLRNISKIEAQAELNTVTLTSQAEYNGTDIH